MTLVSQCPEQSPDGSCRLGPGRTLGGVGAVLLSASEDVSPTRAPVPAGGDHTVCPKCLTHPTAAKVEALTTTRERLPAPPDHSEPMSGNFLPLAMGTARGMSTGIVHFVLIVRLYSRP